jgi:hypothetical protein
LRADLPQQRAEIVIEPLAGHKPVAEGDDDDEAELDRPEARGQSEPRKRFNA